MKKFQAIVSVLLFGAALSAQADSLWTSPTNAERSMYADRKAARKGDILTVVIAEQVAQSSSQSKKSGKSSTVDASVSSFLFPSSGMGKHKGELPVTGLSASNDFSGSGEVSNTQSITGRAAVLVADVLPNGNLVIEGARVITFSGETQYVVLHGIVRADDVTSANTVTSTNIADVRVEFISEGELTDAQKRGWLTKLVDRLRPY
ncbi:MAG: flagellar basal body L-ring protein FlgH [Nibricoccus sp.]